MRKFTLLLFLSFLLTSQVHSQQETIENKLNDIIRDEFIPGIQLSFVRNGVIQNYCAGVIMNNSEKKITPGTIFEAASLSKPVFAYAVLRLYDRRIIDLDAPLIKMIGSYKRFDPSDTSYNRITARMVLRHTTGLPNWGNDSLAPLLFPPDSCFSYSGEGYLYLQRVLEKKLNKPLNQIMQEEVFDPLHMNNSSYVWTDKFDTISSFGNSPEEINRHSNANAAYSLLTNAADYSVFLRALLKGTGLKPATSKMMFDISTSAKRFRTPPNIEDPYIYWGLGVGLQENESGKSIWHWGDNGDFKSFFIAFPERNESLVYFTHSRDGLSITEDILEVFFGPQTFRTVKWLGYGYNSPESVKALKAELIRNGYDNVIETINDLKRSNPEYSFSENDLNELGFKLLKNGYIKEAVSIFKANLILCPGSANAYDSMAEGYEANGDIDLAVENFKRSLDLNPKNDYAAERIKKLAGNAK